MRYRVVAAGTELEVAIDGTKVTVAGQPVDAHLVPVPGTPLFHLQLNGRSHTVAVHAGDGPGQWTLGLHGEQLAVEAVDERTLAIRALTGKTQDPKEGGVLHAPMPGLVVRIEVAVGDRVEVGAVLVVIEAMKMENELRAKGRGVVTAIHAVPGDAVEKGAALVDLDPLTAVDTK